MKLFRLIISCTFVGFLMSFGANNTSAHGGATGDDTSCQIRIGKKYTMHMSGYIPDDRGGREYCEAIPETGHIVIAFDMEQTHLREHEMEIRIVKDLGPDTDIAANTIFHQPYQTHQSGTLYFDNNYEEKGKFFSLVSVRDHEETIVSRFPFTIGYGAEKTANKNYTLIAIVTGLFLLIAIWYGVTSARKKARRAAAV